MKIEDVRELCENKKIPPHITEKFLSEIELTEDAEVVDKFLVVFEVNKLANSVDSIRSALKATSEMRKRRKNNGK